jgi:hypothetical protein
VDDRTYDNGVNLIRGQRRSHLLLDELLSYPSQEQISARDIVHHGAATCHTGLSKDLLHWDIHGLAGSEKELVVDVGSFQEDLCMSSQRLLHLTSLFPR